MSVNSVGFSESSSRAHDKDTSKKPLEPAMNVFKSVHSDSQAVAQPGIIKRELVFSVLSKEPVLSEEPIFSKEDDLFGPPSSFYDDSKPDFSMPFRMKVLGQTIRVEQAEATMQKKLEKLNLKKEQIHRSQLFHGATSASLLAFTNYNESNGALVPLGNLEESGKIPFCGEIVDGRDKVNAGSLSTTWIGELEGALRYSYRRGNWTPEIGKQKIEMGMKNLREKDFDEPDEVIDAINPKIRGCCSEELKRAFETGNFKEFKKYYSSYLDTLRYKLNWPELELIEERSVNLIEVNQKRLLEWEKLDQEERNLVSDPFPVLYGIRSSRKDVHHAVYGVPGEIGLKGGAGPGEIKVIFVPVDKIDFVQGLLARNGHSIPVEEIPDKKQL